MSRTTHKPLHFSLNSTFTLQLEPKGIKKITSGKTRKELKAETDGEGGRKSDREGDKHRVRANLWKGKRKGEKNWKRSDKDLRYQV